MNQSPDGSPVLSIGEWQKRRIAECREWYRAHRVRFSKLNSADHQDMVEKALWAKFDRELRPSAMHRVQYLIDGHRLFVSGDFGHAVYAWSQRINWEFLSRCHLDYFAEKCEASRDPRLALEFHAEPLALRLRQLASEVAGNEVGQGEITRANKLLDLAEECIAEAGESAWWHEKLEHHQELFGPDWYEYSEWGQTISLPCIMHWLGLVELWKRKDEQHGV